MILFSSFIKYFVRGIITCDAICGRRVKKRRYIGQISFNCVSASSRIWSTEQAIRCSRLSHHSWLKIHVKLFLSGVGTIWKWGAPVESKSRGHRSGAKRLKKIFFACAPSTFWLYKYHKSFGKSFRDGQYSLVSLLFLFFYSRTPPVPSHL